MLQRSAHALLQANSKALDSSRLDAIIGKIVRDSEKKKNARTCRHFHHGNQEKAR